MALLGEQLEKASDKNIQRMRQSQIGRAEADYNRRVEELDRAEEKVDIVAKPVAYGILDIEAIK
jgi:hypothetical protein